jgi:hypothetical protein
MNLLEKVKCYLDYLERTYVIHWNMSYFIHPHKVIKDCNIIVYKYLCLEAQFNNEHSQFKRAPFHSTI